MTDLAPHAGHTTLADAGLDRIADTRWDPPMTLGARLVSVIGDDIAHAGQAGCHVP